MLVLYKAELIIISFKINLFLPWYSWKIAELALNTNLSLTHFVVYCYCWKQCLTVVNNFNTAGQSYTILFVLSGMNLFQLFNWFQLFSSDKNIPKVTGQCQLFSVILFSNHNHPCIIHWLSMKKIAWINTTYDAVSYTVMLHG